MLENIFRRVRQLVLTINVDEFIAAINIINMYNARNSSRDINPSFFKNFFLCLRKENSKVVDKSI